MSDDLLNKIYDKVEKIDEKVGALEIIAAKHDENLKEHMQQSVMLKGLYDNLNSKVEPMQADINQIRGIYKFIVFLSILATIALSFIEYFKK